MRVLRFIRQCIALWRFTRVRRHFFVDAEAERHGLPEGEATSTSYRPTLAGPFGDREAAQHCRDELNEIMGTR